MAANKQQPKQRPQAGKANQDTQPRDILELQATIAELKAFREQDQRELKAMEESNEHLRKVINGMTADREAEYDQRTMTIKRAALRLQHTFNSIICPITRREAFKQFVADVIITSDKAIQQANEQLLFDSNINNDLKGFVHDLNRGQIAKPAAQFTDSYATASELRR